MKNVININNIIIGDQIPKICVPIVEANKKDILTSANEIIKNKADIVEWRADFYKDVECIKKVLEILSELKHILKSIPILFTFRTKNEGGQLNISKVEYIELLKQVIYSKQVNLIDIELFMGDDILKQLLEIAHKNNVYVISSNHDFNKTPPKQEIINRLLKMQQLNADIPKIAVMPKNKADVLQLLSATNEFVEKYADRPIITMSMGKYGMISRLCGEIFGSCITFGAVQKVSAPGQINLKDLRIVMEIIHNSQIN